MPESRLRILAFIDWYLPGTKAGGPVRSLYSLINLLEGDVEIGVVTRNTDLGENEGYKNLKTDSWLKQQQQMVYYFSAQNCNPENIRRLIEDYKPDLIYINSFWSAEFSISLVRLKASNKIQCPVLLAPRGMLGQGAMSLKSLKKKSYLFVAKLLGWYRGISFHATQEGERADILKQFSFADVFIAPNVSSGIEFRNTSKKQQNELSLVYLSRVARVKNLHFALECLQSIPAHIKISYSIFGNAEDEEYVKECKEIVQKLPTNVTVKWMGELAFYEVQQTLKTYNALLLPTLNENYGHSIVESLLCGCPIIISDQTPWRGLKEAGCGADLALGSKQAFASEIISLAEKKEADFKNMSIAANTYIRERIDNASIKNTYLKMFNDCAKNRSK